MADDSHPAHSIIATTAFHVSTISRLHSKEHFELPKILVDHPSIYSPIIIDLFIDFDSFDKGNKPVQVTKTSTNVVLNTTTISQHLNKICIQAVIKFKYPLLLIKHYNTCLNNANTH